MTSRYILELPVTTLDDIINHARRELPNECCGVLSGGEVVDGVVRAARYYPLINEAASPVEFTSEARSLFNAHRSMREDGTEIIAVVHSHPTSAPVPSRTDLARNFSEHIVNVIVSLAGGEASVGVWWLSATGYEAAEWRTT